MTEETNHHNHQERFAARRHAHELEKERAIEPLIFGSSKRSRMWERSTAVDGRVIYTKTFEPALRDEEYQTIRRSLVNHHIVDGIAAFENPELFRAQRNPEDGPNGRVFGIQVSGELFQKIRDDMIGPSLLKEVPGQGHIWQRHERELPGKEQTEYFTYSFDEALVRRLPGNTKVNTLFGQVVEETLTHMGLTRGVDFDWHGNGREVAVSAQGHQTKIAPALAALEKALQSQSR